ncbi:MAG: PQQ-binding-like beta-propeller repeat protein [Vicinamibacterales bacterium]
MTSSTRPGIGWWSAWPGIIVWALVLAASSRSAAAADHWPQWRGPDMNGVVADDPDLPERWSATDRVAWKTAIPGLGWSSPVVWGDRVFVTSVVSAVEGEAPRKGLYLPPTGTERMPDPPPGHHQWKVFCLDLKTGRVLWERTAHEGPVRTPRHPKNSYASETPVTDGERLYVLFGNVGLFTYDLNGGLLWSRPIEPQLDQWGWGPGASPTLAGDQLIMVADTDGQSFIVSFDTRTGRQLWRTLREEGHNWATPFVWRNPLRTEIVTAGQRRVRAYDTSGRLLWEFAGQLTDVSIPTPVSAHGMVYISSGYPGNEHRPVYAVRPGAAGDITVKFGQEKSDFVAWYQPRTGAYNPSPIVYGDYYYTLLDGGFLTCHDARTGAEVYPRQRIEAGATFTASPWAYNGKLFLLSEDGNTYVVQAGPQYKLLAKNPLDEMTLASPAIASGRVLIRTRAHLYAIGK